MQKSRSGQLQFILSRTSTHTTFIVVHTKNKCISRLDVAVNMTHRHHYIICLSLSLYFLSPALFGILYCLHILCIIYLGPEHKYNKYLNIKWMMNKKRIKIQRKVKRDSFFLLSSHRLTRTTG